MDTFEVKGGMPLGIYDVEHIGGPFDGTVSRFEDPPTLSFVQDTDLDQFVGIYRMAIGENGRFLYLYEQLNSRDS